MMIYWVRFLIVLFNLDTTSEHLRNASVNVIVLELKFRRGHLSRYYKSNHDNNLHISAKFIIAKDTRGSQINWKYFLMKITNTDEHPCASTSYLAIAEYFGELTLYDPESLICLQMPLMVNCVKVNMIVSYLTARTRQNTFLFL